MEQMSMSVGQAEHYLVAAVWNMEYVSWWRRSRRRSGGSHKQCSAQEVQRNEMFSTGVCRKE